MQARRKWSLLCREDLSPAPCRAQEGEGAKLNGGPTLSGRCLCYHKGRSVWGGHLQKPHSPAIWEVASLLPSHQVCPPANRSRGAGADGSDVNSWKTHRTWSQEETEAQGRQQLSGSPTQGAGFRKLKKSRAVDRVEKAAGFHGKKGTASAWITAPPLPSLLRACAGSD